MFGQPLHQIGLPVPRLDRVQRLRDVVDRIGQLAPVAVAHPEERAGEIVDRLPPARFLAQQRIDVHPDEQSLVVIILAALPAQPALRLALGDHRIVGGVEKVAPVPRGLRIVIRHDRGILIERVLLGDQPRPRLEHIAPELRLPLIDPQKRSAHRRAEIGRPQVRAAPELAIPAMGIFVRQQVAAARPFVPFREIARRHAVLGAAVMLQPDPAEPVGDREQEVVMVVMLRSEGLDRLIDQLLVRVDLRRRGDQLARIVGEDVERHLVAQRDHPAVAPGEHRRIDQHLVIGLFVGPGVAARAGRLATQRARRRPARRPSHVHPHRDATREPSGRIEADRIRLEADHRRGDGDAALILLGRGEELEFHIKLRRALRNVDMESEDIDRIARPWHRLAARADHQTGDLLDLGARRMRAGEPFREKQREGAGLGDGNGLLHAQDAAHRVGRIDVHHHRAGGIGLVARLRDRVDEGDRLRRGIAGGNLGQGGGRCGKQKSGKDATDHQSGFRKNDICRDARRRRPPAQCPLLPSTLMVKASTPMLNTKAARHWPIDTRRIRREVMFTSDVWKVMPSVKLK